MTQKVMGISFYKSITIKVWDHSIQYNPVFDWGLQMAEKGLENTKVTKDHSFKSRGP